MTLFSPTAQVMFITAKIASIFTPLSAVHIYDFHIFTNIYPLLYGFSQLEPTYWQAPSWLFSSVGKSTAPVSQRSWVQIPYRPEFFSGLIFTTCSSSVHYCEDRFHIHVFIRSSRIWFSYIHSHRVVLVTVVSFRWPSRRLFARTTSVLLVYLIEPRFRELID